MSLTDVELAKPFVQATRHVLSTMANITPVPGKPYVKKNNSPATGDVSAVIGLTGDRNGSICLSFTRTCAVAVVRGMLGDDIQDILQDAKDAVGEISNMISGQARAELANLGLKMSGSTPTLILGEKHLVSHMANATVIAIPFSTGNGDFTVEFCFA